MRFIKTILILIVYLFLLSCSAKKIAVKASANLVNHVQHNFMLENDLELAREGLPATIKLAQGLYDLYPRSPYYSGKLCFLYAAYGFAFIDNTPYDDFDEDKLQKKKRINYFYEKAYDYGLQSMNRRVKNFSTRIKHKDSLTAVLNEVEKEDIETLFWFNFSRAMLIFNNVDNNKLLMELSTVMAIADKIKALRPEFMHGAVYAFYLAYWGGRTSVQGGNLNKCRSYYKQGQKIAAGKSLILDFIFMRFVTPSYNLKKEFKAAGKKITDYDPLKAPDFIFINKAIKQKTKKLLPKTEFMFF